MVRRECSRHFGESYKDINYEKQTEKKSPIALGKMISDFYFKKLPGGRENEIFKNLLILKEKNKQWNKIKLTPNNNSLFDFLNKVRNDHLEYAITWYCLAGCLILIFIRYHRI